MLNEISILILNIYDFCQYVVRFFFNLVYDMFCSLLSLIYNLILNFIKIVLYVVKFISLLWFVFMIFSGVHNISYAKKFKFKSEYYKEQDRKENGLSLMDPLKHSSGVLNQNNIGIDVSKYVLEVIAFSPHGTYCLVNKKIFSVGDILEEENNIKILEIREDSIEIGNHNFRHVISIH